MKKQQNFSKQQLNADSATVYPILHQRFILFTLFFAALFAFGSYFTPATASVQAAGGTIPEPTFVSLAGPLQAKETIDDATEQWDRRRRLGRCNWRYAHY